MKDRPIIFSAPMVRAMLDGRKTQTRRLLKGVPPEPADDSEKYAPLHDRAYFDAYCGAKKTAVNPRGMTEDWCWWTRANRCGYGCKVRYLPGDRLYVREAWHVRGRYGDVVEIGYAASQNRGHTEYVEQVPVGLAIPGKGKWPEFPKFGPSIHMPRWASRLTLLVENVRVERLQDISEADAIAEGSDYRTAKGKAELPTLTARVQYEALWDDLHTEAGERWEDNPWVVAITFEVLCGNIDKHPTSTGEGDGR